VEWGAGREQALQAELQECGAVFIKHSMVAKSYAPLSSARDCSAC
jgi:hypothetical protein